MLTLSSVWRRLVLCTWTSSTTSVTGTLVSISSANCCTGERVLAPLFYTARLHGVISAKRSHACPGAPTARWWSHMDNAMSQSTSATIKTSHMHGSPRHALPRGWGSHLRHTHAWRKGPWTSSWCGRAQGWGLEEGEGEVVRILGWEMGRNQGFISQELGASSYGGTKNFKNWLNWRGRAGSR